MSRRQFSTVCALFVSLVLNATAASAAVQASPAPADVASPAPAPVTSQVMGRVTNGGGKVIGGVVVTFDGNGLHRSVTTDANGSYSLDIAPGIYEVTVNRAGYTTASTFVTIAPGAIVTANVTLTESTLSNLSVIGRTSTSSGQNAAQQFNISSSAEGIISQATIIDRGAANLNGVITEIPGVTVNHSTSNPNTSFYVRGTGVETKVLLDGHPIASGTSGQYLSLFDTGVLFGSVDVSKGTGLNGPTAGYSGIGTVNLRTPDFASTDKAFFQGGADNYGGTLYSALADINLLKDNRLSFVFAKTFDGYRGPTYGLTENDINTNQLGQPIAVPGNAYSSPLLTGDLIGWQGDFSNTYRLDGDLAKFRYKFSDATSVTGEFLNIQGDFNPQGGAYGQFVGLADIPECLNSVSGKYVAGNGTACTLTSIYNAPSAQGLVGQKNVPLYTFYPGSNVSFNQPTFNLDFKTTVGNDTVFLRPYTASIHRLIDGSGEPDQYGYGSGSYEVISNANCQATFVAPTATGGAKGPCLPAGASPNEAAYIGSDTTAHLYPTGPLPAGYTCSVATPCYTSSTAVTNSGAVGYTAPYTTNETDTLFGYTFTYVHPAGANTYSLSYDHYYDQAQSLVNDASPLAAGCEFTLSGGALPKTQISFDGQEIGAQPDCTLPAGVSRATPISVPPTFDSVGSLSLTGQFQLTPTFEFDFGNYLTRYVIDAQVENPKLLLAYSNAFGSTSSAPVSLVGVVNSETHYDPHFGFVFRPTRDWAIRGTAGSSISIPYPAQVSGLGSIAQGPTTTINNVNPNLKPEEVVAYDLGTDFRFRNGTIISSDIYNDVIHNAWAQPKIQLASAPPGITETSAGGYFETTWVNTSQEYLQGIELASGYEPRVGFGGRISASLERAYFLDLPPEIVESAPITFFNGEQINQVPYVRGYVEARWQGRNGMLFRVGMDYEGNNNSYNAPAFVLFDGSARFPLAGGFTVQLSGENITDQTFGSMLGTGIDYQGRVQIGSQYKPTGLVNSYSSLQGLVNPGFPTLRVVVQKAL
jgi:outer membrane receptor protein involved in Fe transport